MYLAVICGWTYCCPPARSPSPLLPLDALVYSKARFVGLLCCAQFKVNTKLTGY